MWMPLLLWGLVSLGHAQDRLPTRTRVEGFFGGSWMCENVSRSDVERTDCMAVPSYQILWGNVSELEPVFLEVAFQEMAKRSHNQAQCLNTFFNRYFPPARESVWNRRGPPRLHTPSSYLAKRDYEAGAEAAASAVASPFNQMAWEKFKEVRDNLRGLIALRDDRQSQLRIMGLARDPQDRSSAEAARLLRQEELRREVAVINEGIRIMVAQVPMGSMENVHDAIISMAKLEALPTQETFTSTLRENLQRLHDNIRPALAALDSAVRPDGLYTLARHDRIALATAGGAATILGSLSGDPALQEKLACRMRAYYVNGPRTTRVLELIALTAGSFGVGAIASAPLRMMANLTINAGTVVQIQAAIQDRCLTPTYVVGTGSCDAEYWAQNSIQVASSAMCAAAVIFATGSAGMEVARYFPRGLIKQ